GRDDALDVGEPAVRRVGRGVDSDQGGGDAAPGHSFGRDRRLDAQAGDDVGHVDGAEGAERAEQHVAADTRGGVEPPDAHGHSGAARRATRAANTPAPNPLSMFTTVTPGAQELSIASRAARPPNDAP